MPAAPRVAPKKRETSGSQSVSASESKLSIPKGRFRYRPRKVHKIRIAFSCITRCAPAHERPPRKYPCSCRLGRCVCSPPPSHAYCDFRPKGGSGLSDSVEPFESLTDALRGTITVLPRPAGTGESVNNLPDDRGQANHCRPLPDFLPLRFPLARAN